MDLEGPFLDLEGAILHSLPKNGGRFLRPWYIVYKYVEMKWGLSPPRSQSVCHGELGATRPSVLFRIDFLSRQNLRGESWGMRGDI